MRSRPLSSNTDQALERGQAIVIFSLWIVLLVIMAAAAFDVGQSMLDRRNQQNASDAAALAGARYLLDDPNCNSSPSLANCPKALTAALAVAFDNGFGDGTTNGANVSGSTVTVQIPPGPTSQFANLAGYVQVTIGSTRPSIFAGQMLPSTWNVAAMGVARNGPDVGAPYSFLALNETACPSVLISGQGSVTAGGNIQVNSSCATGALQTTGQAIMDVTSPTGEINVVGDWSSGGNANVSPTPTEDAPWSPDPLADLPPPPLPAAPGSVIQESGSEPIPDACPGGSTPATAAAPATCQFPSSYAGTVWRLFPGYYPGGLKFQAGTFYLEPGIYYLGGGGLDANGNGATIYSVDAGGGTAPPMGGGILLYNTEDSVYHDQCAGIGTFPGGVTAAQACLGPIMLNGSVAPIHVQAIQDGDYAGIVIFQDRALAIDDPSTPIASRTADIQINGSASTLNVVGTIYIPMGLFQANGSGGTASTIQVIADEFKVTGSNASITATYDGDAFFKFTGVGLVE